MSTIVCRGLSFGYDGSEKNVFTDLDLVIDTGRRSALVGRNGRGKTTLLRLIHGELTPDRGGIERAVVTRRFPCMPSSSAVSAFEAARDAAGAFRQWEAEMDRLLDIGDEDSLERYGALQTRFQDAGGYGIDADIARELAALDVGAAVWQRPFRDLSGGERTRCLLAGLFARDEGFVLIDEPTNHLDRAGRAHLAAYLRSRPGFLLVSHDRAFLDACIDQVIALNRDTVETERTRFTVWREHFRQRLAAQEFRNAELRKEVARLGASARDRRAWAMKRESDKTAHANKGAIGARAARQMKRALVTERRAERSVEARRATLVDTEKAYPLKIGCPDARHSRALVTATDLVVHRGGPLFEPVSFRVYPGDRLAIVGPNGCGKTSLADLIAGEALAFEGSLFRPAFVTVAHARQQPRWTRGSLRERLAGDGIDETRLRSDMASLGVSESVLEQPIESMSFGQQNKLEIARSIATPADLLIWDEPLNFIDVDARELIEDAVLRNTPTLVFVEHDAAFIDRVSTSRVELIPRPGRS
ncbi:MAG: ABC-F family ATP-binding cassette domain-containing protein [Immundisolibacterales bacterium]|nr:ABC-F family ATP-binding cassette domain-containing protein [Immundisolibacterales bacterium]